MEGDPRCLAWHGWFNMSDASSGVARLKREKADFNEEELAQHAVVREMLWIFYPQDSDLNSKSSEDEVADQAATAIIASLKYKRHAVMN